ncbi:MAG: DUF2721 domain-containing protein [Bacteroidota bacterium]
MELNLTTPALLFPAISLLLLAYTNRFLAVAGLIRNLHREYRETGNHRAKAQIDNLRKRTHLIRNMQLMGIGSLFLCVLCMFLLFENLVTGGKVTFAISLVMLLISLGISIVEIQISVKALDIQLEDLGG